MIQNKKEIKSIIVALFFIGIIFLSNIQIISNFGLVNNTVIDDFSEEKESKEPPNSSDLNLDDYIVGSGTDQVVRVYTNNESKNLNNNEEFFEIPKSRHRPSNREKKSPPLGMARSSTFKMVEAREFKYDLPCIHDR